MAESIGEALKNLKQKDLKREDQEDLRQVHGVYKMTPRDLKKRETIDFDELFKIHALKLCSDYKPSKAVNHLKDYFRIFPEVDKGLLVYGDLGVGKSLFFQIIKSMATELVKEHAYQGLFFGECTAPWLVSERMASVQTGYSGSFDISSYHKGRLYIDDLGAEKLCFNKYELLEEILFQRHRNNALTLITTNLTPSEIGKRYGERVFDRLGEMFFMVEWRGDSKRG